MKKIELEVLGISSSPTANSGTHALIMKEVHGNRRLPVIIGSFEAQAIALELEKYKRPRPLTHDLFYHVLSSMGIDLVEVLITEIKEGIFYATITFKTYDNNVFDFDARPSDAIALAVRFRCPIFTYEPVLSEAGIEVREEDFYEEDEPEVPVPQNQPASSKDIKSRIQELYLAIEEAIIMEDYEKAAKLRDEIQKLEKNM